MFNNKFQHSVKVPRLYKLAAKIAQGASEGEGSVKHLVYNKKHPNVKALYALVVLSFQRNDEIDMVLKRTQLFEKEPRLDPWLARILITELLWGKKRLSSDCKPVQTILQYEQNFKAHLSDVIPNNAQSTTQKYTTNPRYVRVNTLLMSVHEALESFQEDGWKLLDANNHNYKDFLMKISDLNEGEFVSDIHIPSLLVFPPRTEFFKHPGYKNGALILQDKASCLPVQILSPEPGSIVLDMCASPGMKTTQLAAIMNDVGTIFAIERDKARFDVLNKMVEKSQATSIRTVNKDILRCDSEDFPGVQYILVDPSCSGSGMINRLEIEEERSAARLGKLAGLQIKILRSALTRYPNAQRVVYSTCSLYPEENEDVVRQVLETNESFRLVPAKPFVNNLWLNFGSKDYGDIGKYCLYAKPEDDMTNGFFVAVFERVTEHERNQFFNVNVASYVKNLQGSEIRRKKRSRGNKGESDHSNLDTESEFKNKGTSEEYEEEPNLEDSKNISHKKNKGKKQRKEIESESEFRNKNASEEYVGEQPVADSENTKSYKKNKGNKQRKESEFKNKKASEEYVGEPLEGDSKNTESHKKNKGNKRKKESESEFKNKEASEEYVEEQPLKGDSENIKSHRKNKGKKQRKEIENEFKDQEVSEEYVVANPLVDSENLKSDKKIKGKKRTKDTENEFKNQEVSEEYEGEQHLEGDSKNRKTYKKSHKNKEKR